MKEGGERGVLAEMSPLCRGPTPPAPQREGHKPPGRAKRSLSPGGEWEWLLRTSPFAQDQGCFLGPIPHRASSQTARPQPGGTSPSNNVSTSRATHDDTCAWGEDARQDTDVFSFP